MSDITFLLHQVLHGVLRNAQQGALPPFALTLGLSRAGYAALQAHTQAPAAPWHEAPPLFHELAALLESYRAAELGHQQAEWLAHAIACAAYSHGHLWQGLGVARRETVSQLLASCFPQLFRRNIHNMRWKKFLFAELGSRLGQADLRPPHCEACNEYKTCFP